MQRVINLNILKYMLLLILGGAIYTVLETVYRGHTHWTMFIAGGVSFVMLYLISLHITAPLMIRAVMGGLVITCVEFAFGSVVNIVLGWNVWDYSDREFNILGQVWPGASAVWIALSVPAMGLCRVLDNFVFK